MGDQRYSPRLCFPINELSKHMARCNVIHNEFARHVAAYLLGTADDGLMYHGALATELEGYCDSDWHQKLGSTCLRENSV